MPSQHLSLVARLRDRISAMRTLLLRASAPTCTQSVSVRRRRGELTLSRTHPPAMRSSTASSPRSLPIHAPCSSVRRSASTCSGCWSTQSAQSVNKWTSLDSSGVSSMEGTCCCTGVVVMLLPVLAYRAARVGALRRCRTKREQGRSDLCMRRGEPAIQQVALFSLFLAVLRVVSVLVSCLSEREVGGKKREKCKFSL